MTATYRAMTVTKPGGPETLTCTELPVAEPGPGQLRVRVRAAGVGATDLMLLAGKYRYAPKIPVVPGYEIAGTIDAIGPGVTGFRLGQRVAALTVYGGFAELLVREAEHFLPIPDGVSDVQAAGAILNYVTAWQMIHRVAKVASGQTALVTAPRVASARRRCRSCGSRAARHTAPRRRRSTRPCASWARSPSTTAPGASIVWYASWSLAASIPCSTPSAAPTSGSASALRGVAGPVVGYGFMGVHGTAATLRMFANLLVGARLRGRRGAFYGITMLYRKDPQPLREDLPKIFALIAEKKLDPLVSVTLPLLGRRGLSRWLAGGTVEGKIVLTGM